ncbi:MAG: hypothetical protein HYX89_04450 [Chloroflexi bacterium]|nr:hypothetical protein [Chloroflexota bacterium]
MPSDLRAVILLLHLVAALFMAAPLYALIIVNERARFAVPPGYNTDRYMENIIKNQPVRCYAYLIVIAITGLLLTGYNGFGWGALVTNWAIVAKWVTLLILTALLSYVHFGIQPQIEAILADLGPNSPLPEAARPRLVAWRTRRKRLASICLFLVLTAFIMGVRVAWGYSVWLVIVLLALAALFAWRVFRAPIPYGWF